jgi:hypothetical protein
MTSPGTACARCGHEHRSSLGDPYCVGTDFDCSCPGYLRPVEPNVPMGLDDQPAPTPTADTCGVCGRTMEAHLLDKGAICGGFYAPLPRDPKAWEDDAAPSLGERDVVCVECGITWHSHPDFLNQRARATAEAEDWVDLMLAKDAVAAQRDAARVEVKALGERIALAILDACLVNEHVWVPTAHAPRVCDICLGAAQIARATT